MTTSSDDVSTGSSHGQILRSSAIIGAASVMNIALSLIRMKVAAQTIGPVGVGRVGILQNLVAVLGAIAAVGIGASASRQLSIRRAAGDAVGETQTRRALFMGAATLSCLGMVFTWSTRTWIASEVLADASLANAVGWMAPAVAVTVVTSAQIGLLSGLRRIGDVARLNVLSSLLATLVIVPVLLLLAPSLAILLFILVSQATALVVGSWYVSRLPRSAATELRAPQIAGEIGRLALLGVALTVGGLFSTIGPLLVRAAIGERLGDVELGLFHASWAVGTTYLTIVLQAMSADYFPRLSAQTERPSEFSRLVNQQTEVALLIGGPIILLGIGAAPLVFRVLYGDAFAEAAGLLRWQMLADVLKIASWPLGFGLLALGRGRIFVLLEGFGTLLFVSATLVLIPRFGLEASGVAYLLMYIFYLPAVFIAVRHRTRVLWNRSLIIDAAALVGAAVLMKLVVPPDEIAGALLGLVVAAAFAWRAWQRLTHLRAEA